VPQHNKSRSEKVEEYFRVSNKFPPQNVSDTLIIWKIFGVSVLPGGAPIHVGHTRKEYFVGL